MTKCAEKYGTWECVKEKGHAGPHYAGDFKITEDSYKSTGNLAKYIVTAEFPKSKRTR